MLRKVILMLLTCFLTVLPSVARRLVVDHVWGDVYVYRQDGKKALLRLYEVITPESRLSIESGSGISFFDEQEQRIYTFRAAGTLTAGKIITDSRTKSLGNVSKRYITYLRQSVAGGKDASSRAAVLKECSDPATVVRDVVFLPDREVSQTAKWYEEERRKMWEDYESFRQQCAHRYAEFSRLAWEEMGLEPPAPMPAWEKIQPEPAPIEASVAPVASFPVETASVMYFSQVMKHVADLFNHRHREDAPDEPLPTLEEEPIPEQTFYGTDRLTFMLFDTDYTLRYPRAKTAKLKFTRCTENAVADVIERLFAPDFDNLLHDCLAARTERHLCDWAYYQFLKKAGQLLAPENENIATLITAYLFAESGYAIRLGIANDKVWIFAATEHLIYGKNSLTLDNQNYVGLETQFGTRTEIRMCTAAFGNHEQNLSLRIDRLPDVKPHVTETRTITSERYPEVTATISVDRGLLEFFPTYPISIVDGNNITRWAFLADTPLDSRLADQLYPQLRQALEPCTVREGVKRLLNWVQTGLEYKRDDDVWGYDRSFFSEESLHYPYCDCEDRAILFTRLVRDFYGLSCAIVYYPGHLAAAVRFDEEVAGDYIEVNGDHYVITDPAFIAASVGRTMTGRRNDRATILVLDNADIEPLIRRNTPDTKQSES